MNIDETISTGKQYMTWLVAGVGGLTAIVTIYEIINWQSSTLLIIQLIAATFLMCSLLLVMRGFPLRWAAFGLLMLSGLIAFYLGGSRMGNFELGEVTLSSYLSVGAGLAYLFSAIYYSYSPEIGAYLRTQAAIRKKTT
ncbi:MAG: hypothetical protein AAF570_13920 [Bacteroidota bacterium]